MSSDTSVVAREKQMFKLFSISTSESESPCDIKSTKCVQTISPSRVIGYTVGVNESIGSNLNAIESHEAFHMLGGDVH
jgi:hypothetical protein